MRGISLYDYQELMLHRIEAQLSLPSGRMFRLKMGMRVQARKSVIVGQRGAVCAGKEGDSVCRSIHHAQHISLFYNSLGLSAVAIDSKTPAEERAQIV